MSNKAIFDGIVANVTRKGRSGGVLSGTTFVAKDFFDVEGETTGAGIPDWIKTHSPAKKTARAITLLLDAGADLIGKSCTDQLAFSTDGINIAYGIPANANNPGRIPGGSSSGSASAVSSGLCEFALGTDTLGSIRIPASYCGIFGMRPTHGAISTEGVIPLGQSFDTVGWLASKKDIFVKVGAILLGDHQAESKSAAGSICFVSDWIELLHKDLRDPWLNAAKKLTAGMNSSSISFPEGMLQKWQACMNSIRGYEAWSNHGEWLLEAKPEMDEIIKSRFMRFRDMTKEECVAAEKERVEIIKWMDDKIADQILCFPTTWNYPPACDADVDELLANRANNILLSIPASIGGMPQVNIPIQLAPGKPRFGLSLLAARGSDRILLNLLNELGLS